MPAKISDKIEQEIIEIYQKGLSTQQIEDLLNISRKTVSKILKRNNIESRNLSEIQLLRRGTEIYDEAFEDLNNEDCSYWIGFLYADGSLDSQSKNLISICLQRQDSSHLEKLISFLKTNRKVEYNMQSDNMCRLRFNSEKIVKKLRNLGFDCDKCHAGKDSSGTGVACRARSRCRRRSCGEDVPSARD